MTIDAADALFDYETENSQTSALTGCVNVKRLNVRIGPGTNFGAKKSVPRGECVILIGRSKNNEWVQQRDGWMFASMLEISRNINTLPITENTNSGSTNIQIRST